MVEVNTNKVLLVGKVLSIELKYSYENKSFYEAQIEVARKSENVDILPAIIPGELMFRNEVKVGDNITLEGEIRMTNRTENGCRNIHVFCYVKEYAIFEDEYWDVMSDHNTVELEGYICKKPRYRQTSYSNKEITDLLVANNRRNNKSFYIPCIAWGLLAKMASKFKEGDKITLKGRFQSRRYKADPLNGKPKDYSIQEISIQQVTLAEEAEEAKIA